MGLWNIGFMFGLVMDTVLLWMKLYGEVSCVDSVKSMEDLKSVKVGGGTEARLEVFRVLESEEGMSENATVESCSFVS